VWALAGRAAALHLPHAFTTLSALSVAPPPLSALSLAPPPLSALSLSLCSVSPHPPLSLLCRPPSLLCLFSGLRFRHSSCRERPTPNTQHLPVFCARTRALKNLACTLLLGVWPIRGRAKPGGNSANSTGVSRGRDGGESERRAPPQDYPSHVGGGDRTHPENARKSG